MLLGRSTKHLTAKTVTTRALLAATLVNVIMCYVSLTSPSRGNLSNKSPEFSFSGMEYPLNLPTDPLLPAAITLHESVQFSFDNPQSKRNWAVVESFTPGAGWVRFGPHHRLFVTIMFHEFHCLHKMHLAIFDTTRTFVFDHHVEHCFNYLRQHILCAADGHLEEGDFLKHDYRVNRVQGDDICEDWSPVYAKLAANYAEWEVAQEDMRHERPSSK